MPAIRPTHLPPFAWITTASPSAAKFGTERQSGACRTCHTGVRAAGLPRNHVPTTQDCGACHGTLSWSPARFDHTGLAANCQTCHNGGAATGKVANHMTTSLDCSTCHHYPNWSMVTFTHTSAEYPGEHKGISRLHRLPYHQHGQGDLAVRGISSGMRRLPRQLVQARSASEDRRGPDLQHQ